MDPDKIKDSESLNAWLKAVPEDQRRAWSVFIGSRAAARVAPVMWAEFNRYTDLDLTDLQFWRVVPISRASGICPTRDIAASASSAARAAFAAFASSAFVDGAASAAFAAARRAASSSASAAAFVAADAAAFVAASAAADAADAARTSAAHAAFWEAVRADARHLAEGGAVTDQRGLWPGAMPETLLKDWEEVKAALRALDTAEDWAFWITWYEAELADHGLFGDNAAHWDLLADIFEVKEGSLLSEDDWKEGSARVNPKIRDRYEVYKARFAGVDLPDPPGDSDGEELLFASSLMRAALADFGFDKARRLMAMKPFTEDIAKLSDPDQLTAFLDGADAMRENIERLAEGLKREGGARQGGGLVGVELEGLLEEFSKARQLNELNIGKIVNFGEFLQAAVLDDTTRKEFGKLYTTRLEQIVEGVLELTRAHLGNALLRYAPLDALILEPGTSAWEFLSELRHALRDMATETSGGLSPLAPEDIATLETVADEIERVLRAESMAQGEARSSFQREINYKLALLTVSISLFAARASEHEKTLGAHVDPLLKQLRRGNGLAALWELVKRMIYGG